MKRKVIQISATPPGRWIQSKQETTWGPCLYALCDDGSIWYLNIAGGAWIQLADMPQT